MPPTDCRMLARFSESWQASSRQQHSLPSGVLSRHHLPRRKLLLRPPPQQARLLLTTNTLPLWPSVFRTLPAVLHHPHRAGAVLLQLHLHSPGPPTCTSSSTTLWGLLWTCLPRPRWSPRSPTPAWARRRKRSPACAWPRRGLCLPPLHLVHRERYLLGAAHTCGCKVASPGSLERCMLRDSMPAQNHSAMCTCHNPHVHTVTMPPSKFMSSFS